jgi:hypothetical protein
MSRHLKIFDKPEEMSRRDRIRMKPKRKPKIPSTRSKKEYKITRRPRPVDVMKVISQDEQDVNEIEESLIALDEHKERLMEKKERLALKKFRLELKKLFHEQQEEKRRRHREILTMIREKIEKKEVLSPAEEKFIQDYERHGDFHEQIYIEIEYYCPYYGCYM